MDEFTQHVSKEDFLWFGLSHLIEERKKKGDSSTRLLEILLKDEKGNITVDKVDSDEVRGLVKEGLALRMNEKHREEI